MLGWLAPLHGAQNASELIAILQRSIPNNYGQMLSKFYTNIKNVYKRDGYYSIDSVFKGDFKAEMRYASFSEVNDNSPCGLTMEIAT